MSDPTANEAQLLVQQGRAAALAGDTLAARTHFRRATELDPTCADAWIGLSASVPILTEKRAHLQHVLTLDPNNTEAIASLQYVEKLLAEGLQIAPSRSAEAPGAPASEASSTSGIEYCYRHPDRETGLHCIQCSKPICGSCAYPAPVGQLCPICRRERRPINYKVSAGNIILGGVVAFVASLIAAVLVLLIAGRMGFFSLLIIFIAGPAIAEFVIRLVDRVTRLKRGRSMQITVSIAIALGTLPFALFSPLLLLYLLLAITTAVARLR